jgi:hypothetical protein
MTVLSIPNILIFSFLLYLFISGEKSCMTLLVMQQLKRALLKGFGEDDDVITEEEGEEQKPEEEKKAPVKFEDKYLERFKATEEKDLTPEKLDSLLNSFVMENTPQGNVVMFWDVKRDTFSYYADHLIPYRFLEVVGRKYVLTNDCKKLFVDMEEEIKTAEKKLEEKKKQKEEEEEKQKQNKPDETANSKTTAVEQPKKNVFAKLKSYNRDNSVKSATVALDSKKPQPNIPKNSAVNTKQDENMILKERANRYSYQGRMANFSFLKKVERKVVDKNYAMSFAEFKKMQKEQNKS